MEPEEEEAVDLTSPDFDPAKALSSQAVSLPVPNVRPFENLAQYESAMKGLRARRKAPASTQHGGPDTAGKSGSKDSSTEAGPSARSLPPLVATHRKPAKTLLTRMTEAKQGPLDVLRSCISEKRRVIVTTRTFKGLRGICTGYLVAFDKFWNLAMADVEEVYHKPPLGKKFFNEETLTVSKLLQSETTSQIVSKNDYLMQSTRMKEEEQKSSAAARTEQDTRHCSTQYKGQGAGMDLKSNVKKEPGDRGSGKARSSTRTELHHRSDYKESKEKRHTEEQRTDRRTSSKDSSLKKHGRERDKGSKAGPESLSALESKLTNLQKELAALDAEESDEEEDTVQSTTGDTETQGRTSAGVKGTKAKTRRKPRKQECQFFKRHVNQLFVRGENVVIVSIKDA
ncbi:U7 snRNA-associated Sm-like protein LSm11 [Branchiostoma floridae]|uniref:U7 snRNA-associated Sm-like protein LSm11 n=1 Tax=Branchiostoma floridae TaxID=7739 RepID=A0A9J7NA18_BRAFL|nr:U7 snRNA-associated Sm-like protein LSm11 [Branchiostoma floridae]